MASLPSSVHSATATTFWNLVKRDIRRVEAIIKVILAPLPACIDTYVVLVADHGSAPYLQPVLHICKLKRSHAAPLIFDSCWRILPSQRLLVSTPAASMGGGQTQQQSYRTNSSDGVREVRRVRTEGEEWGYERKGVGYVEVAQAVFELLQRARIRRRLWIG